MFLYLRPGAPCCHMVARPQTSARSHAYVQEDAYAHTHAHPFTHSLTHSLTDTHTHTYAYVHRCRWNAPIINNAKVETGTAAMFSWWHQSGEYWGQTAGGRKWWDHVILLDTTLFVGPCKGFGVTGGPSGQMLVAPPLRTRCLEAEREWSSVHEEIVEYFIRVFSVAFQRRHEAVCRLLNASSRGG